MNKQQRRVHFIGICGTAMATLAAMLKARGFDVQGYVPMGFFLGVLTLRRKRVADALSPPA